MIIKLAWHKQTRTTRKQEALEKALDTAVGVPFSLMKNINQCWPILLLAAPLVNAACLSDIQVDCVFCSFNFILDYFEDSLFRNNF